MIWTLIALVAVTTVAIKAFGPITVGGRELPPWSARVIASMAPALLAALVVTAALADGEEWAIGPDTAGVSVAGVGAVVRRAGAGRRVHRGGRDRGAAGALAPGAQAGRWPAEHPALDV